MSVIQVRQQTSITGRELQNAVVAMVQELMSRHPYRLMRLSSQWEGGSRYTFSGSMSGREHVTGAIDLRFGPPSTVTAQVNLLTSLAEGMRAEAERDIIAIANQRLPRVSGQDTSQPTFGPPAPPEGTTDAVQQQQQQQQQQQRPRRRFDWNLFGNIMTGLLGGTAEALDAYNQVGQGAAQEAVAVAQEEAGKQASAIGPNTGLQHGDGFILGEGKAVGPNAPLPGGRLPSDVPAEEGATEPPVDVGTPSWVWWAVGLGGVVGLGALIYFATREDEEEKAPEWRQNMSQEKVRSYKKMSRIGKKSRKAREKRYPRSRLKKEAMDMRESGYSISEIAAALGVNRNIVKQWVRSGITGNYGFRYFL